MATESGTGPTDATEVVYPDSYQVWHRWDPNTWTHTVYNPDGTVSSEGPYVQADLDAWLTDRAASVVSAESVERQVESALAQDLIDLQTLLDTPNATINGGPAPYIKALARVLRHLVRMAIRRFDSVA